MQISTHTTHNSNGSLTLNYLLALGLVFLLMRRRNQRFFAGSFAWGLGRIFDLSSAAFGCCLGGKALGLSCFYCFCKKSSRVKSWLVLDFSRAQFPGPQRCAVARPMTCAKTAKACKSMNTTPDPPYMWLDANASTCASVREYMPLTVNISSIHIGERRALAWGS